MVLDCSSEKLKNHYNDLETQTLVFSRLSSQEYIMV